MLADELADRLAVQLLGALHREYPNKIGHVLHGPGDARTPRQLTPMFYGCFDWHSAVHGHWSALVLLARAPDRPWAGELRRALDASFTTANAEGELAYAASRPSFEMPYGVAWLLELGAELESCELDGSDRWRNAVRPLVELGAQRFGAWLGLLPGPIRCGVHSQSAFAMGLALDYARRVGDVELEAVVIDRARAFHGADHDAPLHVEPSAHDFLSPSLAAADLMARVLNREELSAWLDTALPPFDLEPVEPTDRSDGKLVHLDGLSASRAWMLRAVAEALGDDHPRAAALSSCADRHERVAVNAAVTEHYAGAHWLATFTLYLVDERWRAHARRPK